MKIKRIEHVGVVVRDVEASRRLWEDCFGIRLGSVENSHARPVRLALYPVGESMVELIAGTTPDSRHARMVAEGKGGLNHICFEVEDIEKSLADFAAQGAKLIDERPRRGAGGHLVAFVHPKSAHGVLVELKQK